MSELGKSRGRRLTHQEIGRIRGIRGHSMLLFITDRCPVGCEHCSVDSRRDSPTISDFRLFGEIVEWICDQQEIEVVGISGGEPFAERRGLSIASRSLASAGKRLVIFTSGVWARAGKTPRWISEILSNCSTVYLSTDTFHTRAVSDSHVVRAAQAVAAAGAWLIVQVLNHGPAAERSQLLLREAFGEGWSSCAEVSLIEPLASGRGADVFTPAARISGQSFGPCPLVRFPMVRYDGRVTACCNESVLMGHGPERLRYRVGSHDELDRAIQVFDRDPLLRVIGDVGLGILTEHPRLSDLASQQFATNCKLCWEVLARMPNRDEQDHLLSAMSALRTDV